MTVITVRDYFASLIRTVVPIVLAAALTKVGITGVEVGGVPLDAVLSVVCVGLYYAAVRLLEARWPRVGVLLGWPVSPTYAPAQGEPQRLHH